MKYATKRGARFDEKHKTRRSSVMPAGRQSLLADWVPSDRGQKRRPSTGTPGTYWKIHQKIHISKNDFVCDYHYTIIVEYSKAII